MAKTVHIEDSSSRGKALLEYLRTLDFVRIEKDSNEDIIANIEQGIKEVNLIKTGKKKATPAKDFLNEL